jgi:adenosyl cobinamide kinase/adenosyl cobinamide phosphate guanylyltransferase
MLTLIIGGARSGKTRYAQSLCGSAPRVAYLATARAEDEEMRARIARHQSDRPAAWSTIEEPLALAAALRRASRGTDVILVDCLTVWLSNLCWDLREQAAPEIEHAALAEIDAIEAAARTCDVVLVSNEVGGGIVPDNPLARLFRDMQGLVNQRAAAAAQHVFFLVAGIAIRIKPGRAEGLTR